MILYLLLELLITSTLAEKKINLEDIERDNLRSESKSSSGLQKTLYSVKPKPQIGNDDYRSSTLQYQTGGLGSFTTAKPAHVNYQQADEYEQENLPTELDYQQVNSVHDSSQYPEYTDQIDVVPKSNSQFNYQQQLYYEPEISVGNQYQAMQQKAVTDKYLSNGYKSMIYIPMSQLLAYYPHLSLGQGSPVKSESLLHQLTSQVGQQIPLYTSGALSRTSIYMPSKLTYKIQPQHITYASQYPLYTQAIISGKKEVGRLHSQDTQGKDLLTTQTVISQPHTQYIQELHYPTNSFHSQTNFDKLKTYTPIYMKGHSASKSHILEQYTQYLQPQRVHYVIPSKSIYQSSENTHQSYEQVPSAPPEGLTPPHTPAQNFKSNHYSISGENDREHYLQNHDNDLSEPNSLLDSYVPSYVIAAKDAERYRERPIKLQSGFLPSKIDLIHSYKKRKMNA